MDELVWGKSRIEQVDDQNYNVHFTDYLKHKRVAYTHRCAQRVTVDSESKISVIRHIDDQDEQERLDTYYRSVGLK